MIRVLLTAIFFLACAGCLVPTSYGPLSESEARTLAALPEAQKAEYAAACQFNRQVKKQKLGRALFGGSNTHTYQVYAPRPPQPAYVQPAPRVPTYAERELQAETLKYYKEQNNPSSISSQVGKLNAEAMGY